MGILRVVLNTDTGQANIKDGITYVREYQVITLKGDPSSILTDAAKNATNLPDGSGRLGMRLPWYRSQYKDGDNTIIAYDISFDKDISQNFRPNGQEWCKNLSPTDVMALWTYRVTYKSDDFIKRVTSSSSSASQAVEEYTTSERLSDLSFDVVEYERYDNLCYNDGDTVGDPTRVIVNAAGDPQYQTRKVYNLLINATYFTRSFYPIWLVSYRGMYNDRDTYVCGIPIMAGGGRINSLSMSPSGDKSYHYKINIAVEVYIQQPVSVTNVLGAGYNFIDGRSGRAVKRRILNVSSVGDAYSFGNGMYGTVATPGQSEVDIVSSIAALQVSEPVALAANGGLLTGASYPVTSMATPGINIIQVKNSLPSNWEPLGIPRKGLDY